MNTGVSIGVLFGALFLLLAPRGADTADAAGNVNVPPGRVPRELTIGVQFPLFRYDAVWGGVLRCACL